MHFSCLFKVKLRWRERSKCVYALCKYLSLIGCQVKRIKVSAAGSEGEGKIVMRYRETMYGLDIVFCGFVTRVA